MSVGKLGAVVSRMIDLMILYVSLPVEKVIYMVFVPSPGVSVRLYIVFGFTIHEYGGSVAPVISHVMLKFAGLLLDRIIGKTELVYQA